MPDKWVGPVVDKMKKGALTDAAARAGMSIDEYCSQKDLSLTDKKRCSLRKTFMSFHKNKK